MKYKLYCNKCRDAKLHIITETAGECTWCGKENWKRIVLKKP